MVEELGADLLPDAKDAHARVAIYHEIYGKDICAKGFVAMRLKWPDAAKMVNDVETKAKQLYRKAEGDGRACCCCKLRRCRRNQRRSQENERASIC